MHEANKHEHHELTITIYYDPDPQDPRDWDNLGVMFCNHRNYDLGDEEGHPEDYDSWDDLVEDMKDEDGWGATVVLALYLYEHGGITMSVGGFGCSWDSGQIGWICDTAENRERIGIDPINDALRAAPDVERAIIDVDAARAKIEEYLKGEVETYDQYLRGEVFGYIVTDEDGEEHGSCWGFFSEEDALSEARADAEHTHKKIEADRLAVFVEEVEASATYAFGGAS